MSDLQVIDNTPHPKILRVLGEIKFAPWQCIAELIDNSIDGFLDMQRRGTPISDPLISVAFGRESVTVKDNGSGMNFDMLEKAVKAGWSSQQELDSLGLYGMGFNIATAVLGSITTIWTTRVGDDAWYGTEIDLQKLAQAGEYGLPRKTREKSDPRTCGTEILITRLKTEHKENLNNTGWVRTNITERLRKVYSTMLRDRNPQPIKFTLHLNSKKVVAKEHCVWPADWEIYRTRDANVRPVQEIDEDFGIRYRNRKTGETFDTPDGIPEEDLVAIPQRVYGWIGIQRYGDEKEYGFDLIRNGRKIEIDCKDFFTWEDEQGSQLLEYPIDDIRKRLGRIVGELHLDHGYVYYTKDHFERGHVSWGHLDKALRNKESLTKRAELGFGPNTVNNSPLGLLFRTFRRNSPQSNSGQGWWDILYFKENDVAKQWAEEWRKGIVDYRDDDKWKQKLKSYDTPSPSPAPVDGDNTSTNAANGDDNDNDVSDDDPILGRGTSVDPLPALNPTGNTSIQQDGSPTASGGPSSGGAGTGIPVPRQLTELNLHIAGVGTRGTTYDVEVFESDTSPGVPSAPWYTRPTARGIHEVYVDINHPVFNSTTLQVRDAILAEMAHLITNEEARTSNGETASFAEMLVTLRDKYSLTDSLDSSQLTRDIEIVRKSLAKCLSSNLDEDDQRSVIDNLPSDEIQRIELAAAQGLANAPLTDYLTIGHFSFLIERNADILFSAGCFNRLWTPERIANNSQLLQAHREGLVRSLAPLFVTMTQFGGISGNEVTKAYLSYVRASVNRLYEFLSDNI